MYVHSFFFKRYATALQAYEDLLKLKEKRLGHDDVELASCLEGYAQALRETGNSQKAKEMETRAQALWKSSAR